MLKLDHTIADITHYSGIILILTAYAWGGYMLYRQYQQRETFDSQ